MKIALISKLWEETGKTSVGGTGMSVGYLADGLLEKGHKVTLFATGNSKTKAKLVSVAPKPFADQYLESLDYLNIASAFKDSANFDLLHFYANQRSLFFAPLTKTPTLHTIDYGEFFSDEIKVLKAYYQENFVAISHALVKLFPFLNWQGVVHNGLDLADFSFNPNPQKDLLIFNGRMSPQKGPDVAIRVAKKLGMRLEMIGKVTAADKDYLDAKVWPYVDGKQIKYLGVLKFSQKVRFMGRGLVLLHPITYFEAFGNVLIEALACGTPVIAFNHGAVPEILVNGLTGFVSENEDQMIGAVKEIEKINRRACRQHVEKNFTVEKMVEGYEKIYQKILSPR